MRTLSKEISLSSQPLLLSDGKGVLELSVTGKEDLEIAGAKLLDRKKNIFSFRQNPSGIVSPGESIEFHIEARGEGQALFTVDIYATDKEDFPLTATCWVISWR